MRVYVFEGKERIKIGYSQFPLTRLAQIQPNIADDITLAYQTEELSNYKLIERLAHKLLKQHRTKGEWFRVSVKDGVEAISKAIDIADKQLEGEYFKTKAYRYDRINVSLLGKDAELVRELRTIYEKERGTRLSLADVVTIALTKLQAKLEA